MRIGTPIPQSIHGAVQKGRALAQAGDSEAARALLSQAVRQAPEHGEARYLLASALVRLGRLPEAWQQIESLLWLDLLRYRPRLLADQALRPLREGALGSEVRRGIARVVAAYALLARAPMPRFVAVSEGTSDLWQWVPQTKRYLRLTDNGRQTLQWGFHLSGERLCIVVAKSFRRLPGVVHKGGEQIAAHGLDLRTFEPLPPVTLEIGNLTRVELLEDARGRCVVAGSDNFAELTYHTVDFGRRSAVESEKREASLRPLRILPPGSPDLPIPKLVLKGKNITFPGQAAPVTAPHWYDWKTLAWSPCRRFFSLREERPDKCKREDMQEPRRFRMIGDVQTMKVHSIARGTGRMREYWVPQIGLVFEEGAEQDRTAVYLWPLPGQGRTAEDMQVIPLASPASIQDFEIPDDCGV